jgi:hypothetical protein
VAREKPVGADITKHGRTQHTCHLHASLRGIITGAIKLQVKLRWRLCRGCNASNHVIEDGQGEVCVVSPATGVGKVQPSLRSTVIDPST